MRTAAIISCLPAMSIRLRGLCSCTSCHDVVIQSCPGFVSIFVDVGARLICRGSEKFLWQIDGQVRKSVAFAISAKPPRLVTVDGESERRPLPVPATLRFVATVASTFKRFRSRHALAAAIRLPSPIRIEPTVTARVGFRVKNWPGKKKKVFFPKLEMKELALAVAVGWWLVAVGDWRLWWRLAVGWWRLLLAIAGGGWRWRLAVGVGWWRLLVAVGCN